MSVDKIGFPVVGCVGFACTSIVDAWTGGYSDPGFWGTVGLALPETGVAGSALGVRVGVADLDPGKISVDGVRCDSVRSMV